MNLVDGPLQPDPADPRQADLRLAELQARVLALRDHPASAQNTAGWTLLDALARRAAALRGPARAWLCQRLEARLQGWPPALAAPGPPAADAAAAPAAQWPSTASSPLRQLLVQLGADGGSASAGAAAMPEAEAGAQPDGGLCGTTPAPQAARDAGSASATPAGAHAGATAADAATANRPAQGAPARAELKALRQFRGSWQRLRSQQRLRSALATVPEQAGPLNSQHLVLRTLTQLQALSPAALDHCLSYLDALAWLDDATSPGWAGAPAGHSAGAATGVARPAPAGGRSGEASARRRAGGR